MSRIVSVDQMRRVEREADQSGLTYAEMMERAGASVAKTAAGMLGGVQGKVVLILVGSGNNGGDGLVAGSRLAEQGAVVTAAIVLNRASPDPHLETLRQLGGEILQADGDGLEAVTARAGSADLIVDAILGTGFRLPLRESVAAVMAGVGAVVEARRPRPLVLAVDCPSGVDCDTGQVAHGTLRADTTVTLGAVKPGLIRRPGADMVGTLVVGDIGLDPESPLLREVLMEYVNAEAVRGWLPVRPSDAHKGTFGKVLIAGGSVNYPGSIALAGQGAYRVGAGLVCLAVPGAIQGALVAALPEATWVILPQEMGVIDEPAGDILRREAADTQALLLGPGLGREDSTRRFLARFLGRPHGSTRGKIGFVRGDASAESAPEPLPQLILDADGLRLVARLDDWSSRLPPGSILTPHPGEMAALTGLEVGTIQANREGVARERAAEWGHIVVLKGAHTVVAAPDGRAWVLPFATDALSKAGTGDVLAGAIAGVCAQGVPAAEACVLAAYLHGRAGLLAAQAVRAAAGVMASEVGRHLPEAIAELSEA